MRALVREAGLEEEIELDSAGTGSWHVGSPPDERATAAAAARGIALEGAARPRASRGFRGFRFDPCDGSREPRRACGDWRRASSGRAKVRLLREFDAASAANGDLDVPDPYYGEGDGFERVLDHVQAACAGLLAQIARASSRRRAAT